MSHSATRLTVPSPLFAHVASLGLPEPPVLGKSFFIIPKDDICQRAYDFAKANIPLWALNHSLRSYAFAIALAHHTGWDQDQSFDKTEVFLATTLHELGLSKEGLQSRMSLELYGGILAREWILAQVDQVAPPGDVRRWADEVCEAITRHTIEFRGFSSRVPLVGALVSLGAGLDLMGLCAEHVARPDLVDILTLYPRLGYCQGLHAFAAEEVRRKPACLFDDCIPAFDPGMFDIEIFQGLQGELTEEDSKYLDDIVKN